jgi:hypothetical protein
LAEFVSEEGRLRLQAVETYVYVVVMKMSYFAPRL